MHVLVHDERRRGRQQHDVAVGDVGGEVDAALAQGYRGQEPIAGRVGDRSPDAPEAHGGAQQELAHQGHGRRHDEEGGVDAARRQSCRSGLARKGEKRGVLLGHAAVAQKAHREGPDAAAFLADLDPAAAQVIQAVQRLVLPVEEPHRLVVEASEREQPVRRRGLGGAALDEARHGLAVGEPPERLHRSRAGQDIDREAVRRGQPSVLLREEVVGAAFAPGAERDDTRRQRLDQPREGEEDHGQRHARDDQVGELAQVHGSSL